MNLLDGGELILFSGTLTFACPIDKDYMTYCLTLSRRKTTWLSTHIILDWLSTHIIPDWHALRILVHQPVCDVPVVVVDCLVQKTCSILVLQIVSAFLCCEIRGCSIEVKEVNSKINRAANHSKVSKTVEIIRFGHIIKTFITFAKRTQYEREGHLWQSQLGPAQHGLHLPQTALSHCCMESLDLLHVPANHVFSTSCPSRVWSERPTLGQSSKTGALWCPRHSLTAICDPGFNLLMI